MAIYSDITATLVNVFCTDCPHWFAVAWTPLEAETSKADHEARVHPECFDVRRQNAKNERRRAGDSIDAPVHPDSFTRGTTRQNRTRQAH